MLAHSTTERISSLGRVPLGDQVVYPNIYADDAGRPLHGASKYILHFGAGQEPAALRWTLSLHASATGGEVSRLEDRPCRDADGSLTILIQRERPQEADCNWLATPEGCFTMSMRFYGPHHSLLDGSWRTPAPVRVEWT